MSHTFDWHKEPEGFLRWMIVNLLTHPLNHATGEELTGRVAEASKDFTELTLTIQLNGVEVPTEYFVNSVKNNMDYFAERAAREMLNSIPKLAALRNRLEDFESQVNDRVTELARQLNIDQDEEYFQ
jgi:hypothetical protein